MVSQYTANKSIPMLTLSNVLGQRMGSISDIIGAGTGAYQAKATDAANKAKQVQQLYQDIFGEYKFGEEQKMDQMKLALEQQKLSQSGSGFDLKDLLGYIKSLEGLGPSATQQSEAQKATTALDAIERLDAADPADLKVAANLASQNWFVRLWANQTATAEQRALSRDMDNLRNMVRLEYTGAAFSPTELTSYSRITGSDPLSTFMDPQASQQAISELVP